ncbi:hypothetical protein N2152v2_011027 [Parachlorella kessleri]
MDAAATQATLSETGLVVPWTNIGTKDVAVGPRKDEYMHTITAGLQHTDCPTLVAIPGYAAGSGFFFRVFDGLSTAFRLFAVDLLGTGLSGRPPFKARNTKETEDFFISSLDKWRQEEGIDKMVLMGHSLGGYLSAVYALRHPERVQHLILVCPAGVGRKPEGWQPPAALRSGLRGAVFKVARGVWSWGVTPGSVIRSVGPWGPGLVSKYARNRFKQGMHLTDEEVSRFEQYFYHILAARGSGEYALSHLLEPFAFPRHALEDRLHELKVPITFIYGDHDWMDPKAAKRVVDTLAKSRSPSVPSDHDIITTPNAGHYPFIDQPGIFLSQVGQACHSYLPAAAQQRLAAAAQQQPFCSMPKADSDVQLAKEMEENPAEAEAHIAAEL